MRKIVLAVLFLLALIHPQLSAQRVVPPPNVPPPGLPPPEVWPPIRPPVFPPIPPPRFPPLPPPRIEVPDVATTPMQVREMTVDARVRGLHATVSTTLVFHNPNARLLEGELIFPLPDRAAVCGYALDINGVLTDGVVVPKEQARVAFETETRARVDPGLVEHVKGNLYRTRIYPLPANGSRTVRIVYTTPLATAPGGDAALLLPMPREPIAKRSITIEVAAGDTPAPALGGLGDRRFERAENAWRVTSVETDVTPGEDVWVALPKLPEIYTALERDDEGTVWFFLSALAPAPADKLLALPSLIHVAWDASGSRSGREVAMDLALLEALPASARYRLIVFRDVPEPPREFASVAELIAAVKEVAYDGGTDFESLAAALPDDSAPVLLFSDGIDTLSGKPIEFSGTKPTAIVSTLLADHEALRQACAGALVNLQTTAVADAVREILNPSPRVAGVKGTGIADLQGLGVPAVGRISVLGRLVGSETTVQLDFGGGVVSAPGTLRTAEARAGRTLAIAWAAARVSQLSPRAEQFEDDLLALGRKFGLVSPATSLLVLESLDQWVRHEIEPPASLPELRDQWRNAMKTRGQQTTDARTQHLAQVLRLWQNRVAWWKTDFSKTPQPVPAPKPAAVGDPFAHTAQAGDAFAAPVEMAGAAATQSFPDSPTRAHPRAAGAPASAMVMRQATGDPFAMVALEEAAPAAGESSPAASAIQIKAWNPDTPYLKALKAAAKDKHYGTYLGERAAWAQSPAFFLDCAEFFLTQGETALGLRILSNLSELRIEDAALLRVYAWRLRQAGQLDRAVVLLRRVAKLRGEDPQSFRDLALVLAERGQAALSRADLEEAMGLLLRVVQTPWARHADILPIFALEELNALVAWIGRQPWKENGKPVLPDYDEALRDNLDTDLRIVLSWDADATDIDLHVLEPTGEEAYYGRNRTSRGGLVSRDITDGYGPEEYLIRRAPHGTYILDANYFGSRQQTVVGPATVTATVYTDWGRSAEKRQMLTLRLDKPREKVRLGSVAFGAAGADGVVRAPVDFGNLRVGQTREQLVAMFGEPSAREGGTWRYGVGARTVTLHFDAEGRLARVVENLPGGVENVLVQ